MPLESDWQRIVAQNFRLRYVTAFIMAPVGVYGMYLGGFVWAAEVALLATVGILEFYNMAQGRPSRGIAWLGVAALWGIIAGFSLQMPRYALLALVIVGPLAFSLVRRRETAELAYRRAVVTFAGVVYIGLPAGLLVAMRALPDGAFWLLVILAITWGTDIFAYLGGSLFGRRKLAPRLSPGKTLEGTLVGWMGGILLAMIFVTAFDMFSLAALVMIIIGPWMAVVGDLLESALKRHYDVKNSHLEGLNIIPGHGGVLDRVDSLVIVTLFCVPYILLLNLTVAAW